MDIPRPTQITGNSNSNSDFNLQYVHNLLGDFLSDNNDKNHLLGMGICHPVFGEAMQPSTQDSAATETTSKHTYDRLEAYQQARDGLEYHNTAGSMQQGPVHVPAKRDHGNECPVFHLELEAH